MEKGEITSKNLQRLANQAGISLKALKKLYVTEDGKKSPSTVYQHWTGHRSIHWRAMKKYIDIFKAFDMDVTIEDFYKN